MHIRLTPKRIKCPLISGLPISGKPVFAMLFCSLLIVSTASVAGDRPSAESRVQQEASPAVVCGGQGSMSSLWRRIRQTVSERERNSVRRCASMGVGVKPCGGSERYIIFSTTTTNVDKLRTLVRRYNQCDRQRNKRLNLSGSCDFIVRPELGLKRGRCVRLEN